MKSKMKDGHNNNFDGFEYDILKEDDGHFQANNGNDVTKKKQKKPSQNR